MCRSRGCRQMQGGRKSETDRQRHRQGGGGREAEGERASADEAAAAATYIRPKGIPEHQLKDEAGRNYDENESPTKKLAKASQKAMKRMDKNDWVNTR